MRWIVEHFGVGMVIVMFLYALSDPRPSDDKTRRGKRYRQNRDWH